MRTPIPSHMVTVCPPPCHAHCPPVSPASLAQVSDPPGCSRHGAHPTVLRPQVAPGRVSAVQGPSVCLFLLHISLVPTPGRCRCIRSEEHWTGSQEMWVLVLPLEQPPAPTISLFRGESPSGTAQAPHSEMQGLSREAEPACPCPGQCEDKDARRALGKPVDAWHCQGEMLVQVPGAETMLSASFLFLHPAHV